MGPSLPDPTELVERIIGLTSSGVIPWKRAFMAPLEQTVTDPDNAGPSAYAAQDEMYGLGRIVLQVEPHPENNREVPYLILGGQDVGADPGSLEVLRQEIEVYFSQIAAGTRMSLEEQIRDEIAEAINYLSDEQEEMNDVVGDMVGILQKQSDSQRSMVELAQSAHNLARLSMLQSAMQSQPGPQMMPPAEADPVFGLLSDGQAEALTGGPPPMPDEHGPYGPEADVQTMDEFYPLDEELGAETGYYETRGPRPYPEAEYAELNPETLRECLDVICEEVGITGLAGEGIFSDDELAAFIVEALIRLEDK